ncbi:MAG: hypothetical protein ACRENG_21655 [bacterium]
MPQNYFAFTGRPKKRVEDMIAGDALGYFYAAAVNAGIHKFSRNSPEDIFSLRPPQFDPTL